MNQVEVLAFGSWPNSEGLIYQPCDPTYYFNFDEGSEAVLGDCLRQHGAVLFRYDDNHPDLGGLLGSEWFTWAFILCSGPWARVGEGPYSSSSTVLEGLQVLGLRVGAQGDGLCPEQVSDQLVDSYQVSRWLRPWTCGPVSLTLRCHHSEEQLQQWLDALPCSAFSYSPLPEGVDANRGVDFCWQQGPASATSVAARYLPEQGYFRVSGCDRRDGELDLYAGALRLTSSLGGYVPECAGPENSILAAVLNGDLGEIEWELFDHDYCTFAAQGPDLESLRAYLNPHCDWQQVRDNWKLQKVVIDCQALTSWEAVAEAIAAYFGQVPDILHQHLAGLRNGQFSREIRVELSEQLDPRQANTLVPPAPKISWTFAQAQPRADRGPTLAATYLPSEG